MTTEEKLLAEAPGWTDAQATAALHVVEAQAELEAYLENEANLSADELDAREDARAERTRGDPRRALVSRGGVCWLELEVEGRRPVCVLTRDEAIGTLRNVVVAPITPGVGARRVLGAGAANAVRARPVRRDGGDYLRRPAVLATIGEAKQQDPVGVPW